MKVKLLFTMVIGLSIQLLFAQDTSPGDNGGIVVPQVSVKKTAQSMTLDGVLNEPAYFEGNAADRFLAIFSIR